MTFEPEHHSSPRRPLTRKAVSPFRYPGGKGFLADMLSKRVLELEGPVRTFAEPFCGGAGAAIKLLLDGHVHRIHLNDLDPCVYSAWVALVTETDRFLDRLCAVPITVEEWRKQRQISADQVSAYDFDVGFATFFLNRTSRAGIVRGSGPIGGYEQRGKWRIDARFYRSTMINRIERIGSFRDRIEISNQTAEDFLDNVSQWENTKNTFVFLDPPYFQAGSRLYLNGMGADGHVNLAEKLKTGLVNHWLMTYDDHPEIRRLYSDFDITKLDVHYSLQKNRQANEVMIQAAGEIE